MSKTLYLTLCLLSSGFTCTTLFIAYPTISQCFLYIVNSTSSLSTLFPSFTRTCWGSTMTLDFVLVLNQHIYLSHLVFLLLGYSPSFTSPNLRSFMYLRRPQTFSNKINLSSDFHFSAHTPTTPPLYLPCLIYTVTFNSYQVWYELLKT